MDEEWARWRLIMRGLLATDSGRRYIACVACGLFWVPLCMVLRSGWGETPFLRCLQIISGNIMAMIWPLTDIYRFRTSTIAVWKRLWTSRFRVWLPWALYLSQIGFSFCSRFRLRPDMLSAKNSISIFISLRNMIYNEKTKCWNDTARVGI